MKDTGFWLAEADRPRLATVYTRNGTSGVVGGLSGCREFPCG